uniref:C3H1-type domain-containing protein n=1 Tax=Ditylenchus dipsaci TaxID=166011 RepID=A0A915EET5_9BILA
MHHYRAQARQQGVLANSNSSPCLFGMASAAAIAAGAQQQLAQKHAINAGEDASALPMAMPSHLGAPAMSSKLSSQHLMQFGMEIHNVRAPNAASQDLNLNSCATKGNRQDAYKTVMCQAWLESTKCSFGDNCKFAHGETELRPARVQPRNNTKYKTKLCDKYTTTGICPYGIRCLFIHPPTKGSPPESGVGHSAADNSFNNPSPLLSSAMAQKAGQSSQLELLRKLLAVTANQQQQLMNTNAYINPNFPTLPNAYSMPSVFGGDQQGSKTGRLSNVQKEQAEWGPETDRPSAWSQVNLGMSDRQEIGSQDGLLTPNGGRPHPSWPLEPPKFFNDMRRSSCIEHVLTAPVLADTADKEHQIASKQIKDRFGYQARNFGARFHHQSMPLFNLPANLQQHLPNSRKISKASCGEPPAVEDLEEYPALPTPPAPMQRSSTQMTIGASNIPSPSNFRPLKKRFSNGVLHSVTPHSHYSSQSSCNSCTSSSVYLGGTMGRDVLAEICFWRRPTNTLEIPPCLAESVRMATPYYNKKRHLLERDMTLTEGDVPHSNNQSSPIDELSRQMEMQKLEEFLIATSENCVQSNCTIEALEKEPSSDFESNVKGNSPTNMVFQEFTDFDEIPALN